MARVPQQHEIPRRMAPLRHLPTRQHTPFRRLLHNPQQRLQPLIPAPEQLSHLLRGGLRDIDVFGHRIGADDDDVVVAALLEEIANHEGPGSDPDVVGDVV